MIQPRNISKCQHSKLKTNCRICGSYLHNNKVIKTQRFVTNFCSSSQTYLKHLRKRSCQVFPNIKNLSQQTSNLLESICQKFQFSLETLSLGIYIYAYIDNKDNQKLKSQNKDYQQNKDKDQNFLASAALIVAAKAIELDRKVPYLNRYQRYAEKSRSKQQYQIQERLICQALNFNIQYSTFITFLNFFLSNGILFENDYLDQNQVAYFQDEILNKAKDLIKKGQFIKHQPQNLAISIIKQIRKKYKLLIWPQQLQIITGIKLQINCLEQQKILQPIKTQRDLNCPKNLQLKYITLRNKKRQLYRPSTIKQNSLKDYYPTTGSTIYSGLTKSMSILKNSNTYTTASIGNILNYIGTRRK